MIQRIINEYRSTIVLLKLYDIPMKSVCQMETKLRETVNQQTYQNTISLLGIAVAKVIWKRPHRARYPWPWQMGTPSNTKNTNLGLRESPSETGRRSVQPFFAQFARLMNILTDARIIDRNSSQLMYSMRPKTEKI